MQSHVRLQIIVPLVKAASQIQYGSVGNTQISLKWQPIDWFSKETPKENIQFILIIDYFSFMRKNVLFPTY